MKKFAITVLCGLLPASLLLSGCSFFRSATPASAPVSTEAPIETPAPTPEPTPEPKPVSEQLVGSWRFDHLEDGDGDIVSAAAIAQYGSGQTAVLASTMMKALQSNTTLTFTEDGRLKIGVLSVNYTFESETSLRLSGGVLPQSYSGITVFANESQARVTIGEFTLVLTRK